MNIAPNPPTESEAKEGEVLLRRPRTVGPIRGLMWIGEAFSLFRHYPIAWLLTGLSLIGLYILFSFIPLVGGLLYTLISTVILGGIALGCAAQEIGEDYSTHYLAVAFDRPQKLVALALLYLSVTYVIVVLMLGSLLSQLDPSADLAAVMAILSEHPRRVMATMLLMLPMVMAKWFGLVLIALHDVPLWQAMGLSFSACLRNALPMTLLAMALFALFLIGMVPLFLGVLVIYPVMIISSYTSYRDVFTHEQVGFK
ncbi:MAG: BPSS1780 family membrane protein [Pseudomonadota bacterium]